MRRPRTLTAVAAALATGGRAVAERAATVTSRSFVIMRKGSVARGDPSSARGSNFAVHPRVETDTPGSTLATMTPAREGPTVQGVKLVNVRELPPIAGTGPPVALRIVGFVSLAVVFLSAVTTDPTPGLHGDGPWVALGIVLMAGGVLRSLPRRELPDGQRLAALVVATIGVCLLTALQPHSAAFAGIYYVVVIAGMRLDRITGLAVAVLAVGALVIVMIATGDTANGAIPGLIFSVVPWFSSCASSGGSSSAAGRPRRSWRSCASRAPPTPSRSRSPSAAAWRATCTTSSRTRSPRSRCSSRAHGCSPATAAPTPRSSPPSSAPTTSPRAGWPRRARRSARCAGTSCPAPSACPHWWTPSARAPTPAASCSSPARPSSCPPRRAWPLYRTAQEALTNIRRHSAADRVEIGLRYAPDGTTLVVQDHGPGAPVTVGATTANGAGAGGGYGLTGMRERAELLGGRLCAEPTGDGFRVELWLPG